jgi:hypothetical protein
MLNIFGCINLTFGLLGAVAGVIVLRGVFHRPLSSGSTVRFLMGSLFASLAGLMPLTRHVTPVQLICMLSVYCSAAATVAWLKFGLARHWRQIFTLCLTAILYFDIIFVATRLFKTPPLLTAPLTKPLASFQLAQILFAGAFIVLGILAARKCPNGPASVTSLGKLSHTR